MFIDFSLTFTRHIASNHKRPILLLTCGISKATYIWVGVVFSNFNSTVIPLGLGKEMLQYLLVRVVADQGLLEEDIEVNIKIENIPNFVTQQLHFWVSLLYSFLGIWRQVQEYLLYHIFNCKKWKTIYVTINTGIAR